jgi:hypothetical protein
MVPRHTIVALRSWGEFRPRLAIDLPCAPRRGIAPRWGADVCVAPYPGFRCAPPWAMEFGPFGAGGLRPSPAPRPGNVAQPCSTEGASFHSPGCNPGFTANRATVALKGRHSPDVPNDNKSHRNTNAGDGFAAAMPSAINRSAHLSTRSPYLPPRRPIQTWTEPN